MNIDQLMEACVGVDPEARSSKIGLMKQRMMEKMQEIQSKEKSVNKKMEIKLFETFIRIIEKISAQVDFEKQRYLMANFEEMRNDKMIELAKQIKFLREECHFCKQQIKNIKNRTKGYKSLNEGLRAENSALKTVTKSKLQLLSNIPKVPCFELSKRYQSKITEQCKPNSVQKQVKTKASHQLTNKTSSNSINYNRRSLKIDSKEIADLFISRSQLKKASPQSSKYMYKTLTTKKNHKRTLNFFKQQ